MISFPAIWFDGRSSRAVPVTVSCEGDTLRLKPEGAAERSYDLKDCAFNPPLGKTARVMVMPDGSRLQSNDFEMVALLEELGGHNRGMRFVAKLEGRWRMAAVSALVLIAGIWLAIVYGIPLAAKQLSYAAGDEILSGLTQSTMQVLDDRMLKPTELEAGRAAELKEEFGSLYDTSDGPYEYRLEFRNSPSIGPNAFALPSGLIIMTDQLVEMAEDDDELMGILYHEIAHVRERHAVRAIIQNAGVFFIVSAAVGDIASISSLAASLPTMLARTGYSRDFEREADAIAAERMVASGRGTAPLAAILRRMNEKRPTMPGESIYSTHPVMEERLEYLEGMKN